MNAIKIILCVVVGVLLANFITYIGYKYFIENNNHELNKNLEISSKNQNSKIYSELRSPKINITLRSCLVNRFLLKSRIFDNKLRNVVQK